MVVGERHCASAARALPRWWGLWLAHETDAGLALVADTSPAREATENPRFNRLAQAKLLWSSRARVAPDAGGRRTTGTPASRRALPEIAASELTVDQVEAEIVIALPARGRERHASEKIETACSDVCGIEPLTGPPRGRARRAHRRGLTRSRRTPVALGAPHSARSEMLGQFHRLPGLRTSRVRSINSPSSPVGATPSSQARSRARGRVAHRPRRQPDKFAAEGLAQWVAPILLCHRCALSCRRALADSRSATPLARSRTTRAIAASWRASAIRRIDLDRSILEDLLRRRTSL